MKNLEALMLEEERERNKHPCCLNCTFYYSEYGWDLCRRHEDVREEPGTDRCDDWE